MLLRSRVLLSIACLAALVPAARAATLTSSFPLGGSFTAGISGGGTATLNGASGTFRQWLLFTHANIGVSAGAQNVGLSVNTVPTQNFAATGDTTLTYDNDSPPTAPLNVDSLSADFISQNVGLGINVNPLGINTSLGNFNLELKFNGQITDLVFVPSGPSEFAGDVYNVPGKFVATISGAVTGRLVNVPLISTVDLGTLYTLEPSTYEVEASLPGLVTTADSTGGNGPYPADLLVNYQAALENIVAPIELPFEVHINQTVKNGQSGFSKLDATGSLTANLTFENISYNLNGSVANVVVPEPQSIALMLSAAVGALLIGLHRRGR